MLTIGKTAAERFRGAPCTMLTTASADRLFFPGPRTPQHLIEHAKGLCNECPVKAECLKNALEAEGNIGVNSRYGIFGGLTPKERKQLANKKNRKTND